MNVINLLLYELEYTYNEEGWYPPLKSVLTGLTYEQAAWKPKDVELNSIWEITAHLLYYKERLLWRLQGKNFEYASNNRDTFVFEGNSQADWDNIVLRMHQINQEIYEHIQKLNMTDLENETSKSPLWKHISGIIRHDAHHAGQIIILRRLQGAWPA